MKLLMLSSIRHMKKHWLQMLLTYFMTILIVAMLSSVFNFASSFMNVLRRSALENVGSYHYKYNSDNVDALCKMAEDFENDSWFSKVSISESNDQAVLELTVAHPGLFTTKTMEKKFEKYKYTFGYIGGNHNWDLLVSYGDLCRQNGMYAFLLIFIFLVSIISIASILTLGSVLKISSSQRERDFALLSSIGADSRQIGIMLLIESMFYAVIAIPLGILLGIYLLSISCSLLDRILTGLGNLPPVTPVAAVPYNIVLVFCSLFIILGSAYIPAYKASKIRPIELLRQNQAVRVSKFEIKYDVKRTALSSLIYKIGGIEGFLAHKTHNRFKSRYYPVLFAVSINIALCLVLSSLSRYSNDVIGLTYEELDYNIDITLSSNNQDALDTFAKELMQNSDYQIAAIRTAVFELREPYPLSEAGIRSGLFHGSGRMPDVMLVSISQESFRSICNEIKIDINELKGNSGIFINTERTWLFDGALNKEKLYYLMPDDILPIYSSHESYPREDSQDVPIEMMIKGIIGYWPPYTSINMPTTLAVLVSEETFLELEKKQQIIGESSDMYIIYLRGMLSEPGTMENITNKLIEKQALIHGEVKNFDSEIRQEQSRISSIRYLMYGLIMLLIIICLFSNFLVTWIVSNSRKKELAILASIGMTPYSIKKMKTIEAVLNGIKSLMLGATLGIIGSLIIHKIYMTEYHINWSFPFDGLLIGILILLFVTLISEIIISRTFKKIDLAEILREDEF